jgi:L,D-transpeptidase ErfK/SrfK
MAYYKGYSQKIIFLLLSLIFSVVSLRAFGYEDVDLVFSQRPEAYGLSLCQQPGFHCIYLHPGDTWEKRFPDPFQRDLAQRLNRTNIPLKYRKWIVVPNSWQNLDYLKLGPFARQIAPPGQKLLLVDLQVFAFAAYDAQGKLLHWGPASGGDQWCSDSPLHCKTAAGTFRIYRMKGADCVSNTYPLASQGGAHMPYCMYYFKGYALHAYTMTGFVHRSHGCVHLFYEDAKWLQEQFVELGTAIIVRR